MTTLTPPRRGRPPKAASAPEEAEALSSELRPLARVLRQCIGVLVIYWNGAGMAPGHPYRHAANMLDSYLKERYKV